MFESRKAMLAEENDGNGRPEGVSASDQRINWRKFGTPVEIEFAGEKFALKGASFIVCDIIHRLVDEARYFALAGAENIKKTEGKKGINEQLVKMNIELKSKVDANMFRAAQLILYTSRNPDWVDKFDEPSETELNTVTTVEKIRRRSPDELNALFETFYQLNKPELPRQSFFRLGTIL